MKKPPYVVSTDSEFEPDDDSTKPAKQHKGFGGKGGGWEIPEPTPSDNFPRRDILSSKALP